MSGWDKDDRQEVSSRASRPSRRGRTLTLPTTYEVGYGKPPAEHRFQKGRSGNPKGRPKGAKGKPKLPGLYDERLPQIILAEAGRTITVRDGDRNVTVTMAEAVVRGIAVNAAKGHVRAQKLFAELMARAEGELRRRSEEHFQTLLSYKKEGTAELARRKRLGITHLPDLLPHPDDILIHPRKGTAVILGPMTPEEVAEWDDVAREKSAMETVLADFQRQLDGANKPEARRALQKAINALEVALEPARLLIHDDREAS